MTAPSDRPTYRICSAVVGRPSPFEQFLLSSLSLSPNFSLQGAQFWVGHRMRMRFMRLSPSPSPSPPIPSFLPISFGRRSEGSGEIWFSRIIDFSSSIHLSILRRRDATRRSIPCSARSFVRSLVLGRRRRRRRRRRFLLLLLLLILHPFKWFFA